MAVGSGLGATLGISPLEGTYGTIATPTRWLPIISESLAYTVNTAQGEGLSGSGGPHLAGQRVVTAYDVAGSFQVPILQKQMGPLLADLAGQTAASTQVSTTPAYAQSYVCGATSNLKGKSRTYQFGIPSTDGTVRPKSFLGGKIVSGMFECDSSGIALATFGINGRSLDSSTALTAATLTGAPVHNWPGLTVALDTSIGGSGTALNGVRKVTVTVTNGVQDPFYAGQAGLKSEPIQNARPTYTIALDMDYVDDTLAGYYRAQTPVTLIVTFQGAQLAASPLTYATLSFTAPYCVANGSTPQVGGPGIVQPTFTFDVLDDASHTPMTIGYVSAETTP